MEIFINEINNKNLNLNLMIAARLAAIPIEALIAGVQLSNLAKTIKNFINLPSSESYQQLNLDAIIQQEQYFCQSSILRKTTFYDDEEVKDFNTILHILSSNILKVERWCQSSTGIFPSGIFTAFTWTLAGVAIRDEFVVLETSNHIISIELKNQQNQVSVHIKIWSAQTQKDREKIREQKIFPERNWLRKLNEVKPQEIKYYNINTLINLVLELWKEKAGNDKSLSRTIIKFSEDQPNYVTVLESILGMYSDKPLNIPNPMAVLSEEVVWQGQKLSSDRRKVLQTICQYLKHLREFNQA